MAGSGLVAVCALLAVGCGDDDCRDVPVLQASISVELAGGEPSAATALYAVQLGEDRVCGERGQPDDGETGEFVPAEGRVVIMEPAGGEPVTLAEGDPGWYQATDSGYAESYQLIADGRAVDLGAAPPYFTAEMTYTPEAGAAVTWTGDFLTEALAIDPTGVGIHGTSAGQGATWAPSLLELPGEWTIQLLREGGQDGAWILVIRELPFTVE